MFDFSILFYFILQIDANNNVRWSMCSMTWYKTVTYRKSRVYANNTTELGRAISFWLARKSFSTTVSNDLSRANQIDMTGPNSVVLFAQTIVCSLCNYYKCEYRKLSNGLYNTEYKYIWTYNLRLRLM